MYAKKYTVIIFLFVLFIPAIDGVFNLSALLVNTTSTENRIMAKKPDIDITSLDYFPPLYEAYYNDHFPFRSQLVYMYDYIQAVYFNRSPFPDKVLIGKNNWLYNAADITTYNGSDRLPDTSLDTLLKELTYRKQYLEQRNCSMYVFIIPTKFAAYPEYIRGDIKMYDSQPVGEQVAEYFKKNSNIPVIDLLPSIMKAKVTSENPQFCLTDTHWSEYGAYICYKAMINELSAKYTELKPIAENELISHDTLCNGGNIATMLDMAGHYRENMHKLRIIKPSAIEGTKRNYQAPADFPYPWAFETQRDNLTKKLPKALIIGDSFVDRTIPFFAESFSHSTFIFDGWKYRLNKNIVETEKPDIVIYLIYEPLIKNILLNKGL